MMSLHFTSPHSTPFHSMHRDSVQELEDTQLEMLFLALQETATSSLTAQGMTRQGAGTYRDVEGNRGSYGFQLLVYGQDALPDGTPVLRDTEGPHGRTIWYTAKQLRDRKKAWPFQWYYLGIRYYIIIYNDGDDDDYYYRVIIRLDAAIKAQYKCIKKYIKKTKKRKILKRKKQQQH